VATRYPLRIAAGMLSEKVNVEPWLMQNSRHLPHGETEAKLILNQLQKGVGVTETTSCGRVLDAVAAVLGVCYERTYEGEPAMKLEAAAIKGKDALSMQPLTSGNVLDTTQMFHAIFENIGKASTADLAYSAHAYLARGLASLAVEKALEAGVKTVGFSGGAACNQILAGIMRRTVEAAGLKFLVHEAVPAGDGGVSFGQAVVGGFFRF
jgi:hydrogenase maturation protein HypF